MLTLTPVETTDVGALLALIRELAELEKLAHEVVATEETLRESLFGGPASAEAVLARVGGAVAGFAIYFHNFSTFQGRHGLHLEDLYVRSDFRGQGVGTALLAHVARVAVARRCGRLEWSVLDWNRRAIDFYTGMGARPVAGWSEYRLEGEALASLAAEPGA
jgi:GNAT superfamily N-acetyltransferase